MAETKKSLINYSVLNTVLQMRSRGASSAEIARHLGVSTQLANYHLLHLTSEGYVERIEAKKVIYHKPYVRYAISQEGKKRLDALLIALAGGQLEETELNDLIDLDFQNLHTLFRQFVEAIKAFISPAQWELLYFLRGTVTGEISKVQQAMKLRLTGAKKGP